MNNAFRNQGHTFRLLLKAIIDLSNGERTVVITHTTGEARSLFTRSLSIIESYIGSRGLEIDAKNSIIRIIGCNGELHFISKEKFLIYAQGRSPFKTHRDC